jgi:hypothetical protein
MQTLFMGRFGVFAVEFHWYRFFKLFGRYFELNFHDDLNYRLYGLLITLKSTNKSL